jgi:ribonuclease E
MMGRRFSRIVEECLHRLDRGEDLLDVLADYPGEAEQLKPLLLVAMASRSITMPIPSQTAHRLGRNQMLSAMDSVSSSPVSKQAPFYQRARDWSTRTVNNLRAQFLVRPAPSYRLAIIALIVVFGSGFFAFTASASPGDFLNVFSADFQGVMALFDRDSSEEPLDFFSLFSIFSENYGLFFKDQATNLRYQLKETGDSDNPGIAKNRYEGNQYSYSSAPSNPDGGGSDPGNPSGPKPTEPPDGDPDPTSSPDQGPDPTKLPDPFPGNAVNVVNEVVSDTAKEKNPVWDQLPFNQTDDNGDLDDLIPADDDDVDDDQDCSDDGDTGEDDACEPLDDDDDDDDDDDYDDDDDKDKKPKKNIK